MEPSPVRFKPLYNQLTLGYLPAIVNGAQQAGIFELLQKESATAAILAQKLQADPGILEAILKVLVSVKLLTCDKESRYHVSRLAKHFFVEASPASQIRDLRTFCMRPGPFDDLADRLKKGPHSFDSAAFSSKESLLEHEQRARGGQIQEVVNFICDTPEFASFKLMCDFAGNSGYYSEALLNKNPHLRSRVYETPDVVKLVRQTVGDRGTSGRLEFVEIGRDIHREDFGRGYDLFFVSHFLYHLAVAGHLPWFFKKVNQAMLLGGIFVSNHIGSAETYQDGLTQSILELLVRTQGYPTLTLAESNVKQALSQAGFSEFRIRSGKEGTHLNNTLISARKIKEM